MTLLNHSTDTRLDEPVTDVMASNAAAVARRPDSRTDWDGSSDRGPIDVATHDSGASAGLIISGFLALMLAAWAGIIPFVGPLFGYSADGTSSWTWDRAHVLGALVPGAVGVLACMLIIGAARRPRGRRSTYVFATWGLVLFLCGAWLTVTPVIWPAIESAYFHAASPSMTFAYWMGYASGPGILLVAFGAFVMSRAGRDAVSRSRRNSHHHRVAARDVSDPLPSMEEMHSQHVTIV